uniref:U11/U12 small nuclear ribonucleoprotein 48 kDa protein-like isoform X1 n=1 Tax=Ciona intestinalis TaxID=7719 RepID=UPI00006A3C38|nr:U11/U12 small nuclear ribonucleoprotein 48 kDa protein-like isoform X1 [Ciona intestinalis]|eukprot:XP_002126776.1 U11/U12 small nuclear ribonucleoprotein 48 kDa protein-like isoform X1 [Ciona intestinalis]
MENQTITNNSELNAYTLIARNILNKFDAQLEWSSPTKEEIQCPFNRNHVLTFAKYNEHVAKCKWKKHGYSDHEVNDIISEENSDFPFPSVQIDEIISSIAPNAGPLRTNERFTTSLTTEQKLLVYDRIMEKIKTDNDKGLEPNLFVDFTEDPTMKKLSGSEKITELDFRKNMRDHKRRRQTYRAKNVHITKRSQTEIVRDVLKIHMEELKLAWSNKSVSGITSDERPTCDKSSNISHEHSSRDCDKRERSESSTTHKRNRSQNAREDRDHNREKSTAVMSHDRESDFREKRDETRPYKHHSHGDTHENRDHKHERSHERVYKSSKKSKRRDSSPDSRHHKHHKKEKKRHKENSRRRKLSSEREP